MAAIRTRLANPPISEALIDIRIAGAEPSQEVLKSLGSSLKDRYPRMDERRAFEAKVSPAKGSVESKDRGFFGYFLQSQDEKTTVQLKKNGFTLNRLNPYTGGDRLVEEALGLWQQYANVVRPEAVSRLAIRYINRLDLPFKDGDGLERFLHAPPIVPQGLPQRVTDFMTRLVVVDSATGITTIVNQVLNLAPGGPVPFILDLDVFKLATLLATLPTESAQLDRHLQSLRTAAKSAFFGSLTEETVNLYA